jgi:hypothetical protein
MRPSVAIAVLIKSEDLSGDIIASMPQDFRLLIIENTGDDDKPIAPEDIDGMAKIRGLQNIKALDPVMGFQMLA